MLKQLLPPHSWDEFEKICHDLWTELLSDPEAKMHGRRGQSQNSVDVYGYDLRSGTNDLVGIQCKGKDNFLSKQVTEIELRQEVKNAISFTSPLKRFILATTAVRDASVQAFTRTTNAENIAKGLFSVSTWDWSTISEAIQDYPSLVRKYYPEAFIQPNLSRSKGSIVLRLPLGHDHEQKIAALFELQDIKSELESGFRFEIRDFVIEIASNAYRHGGAKGLEIEVEANKIVVRDNGAEFDILKHVACRPANVSMQGLKYIQYFIKQYAKNFTVACNYDNQSGRNVATLQFNTPIARIQTDNCVISFSDYAFIGRTEAELEGERLRLPDECSVYTMHLDRQCFMMSSLYMYLLEIVKRLPKGKKLNLVLQTKTHKPIIDEWFDPTIVQVISH